MADFVTTDTAPGKGSDMDKKMRKHDQMVEGPNAQPRISTPIPDRINDIQTGYAWYRGCEPDEELRSLFREDQLLLVTCPDACPKLVADFNRGGGLVVPYVSTYKAPVLGEVPDGWNKWEGGSPAWSWAQVNPFWQAVDLTGHPDWILYVDEGQPRRPFDYPTYMPGWYQTNPLAEGYCRAVLWGIEALAADPRFDGIFYDNFYCHEGCGSVLPTKILKDNEAQTVDARVYEKAIDDLAWSIRRTGDNATDGHFWMVLNGVRNEVAQQIADILMIESFLYSWAWTRDWDDQQALDKLMEPVTLRRRGGRVMPMPYFGFSGSNIADDARRVRRLTDQANAIFSDLLTLARPELVSVFARRNTEQGGGKKALEALKNEVPGDIETAREVYRV